MNYNYLVVGCGLSGMVIAEQIASVLDKKVLIIDRRPHIGGNIYDYTDESGITIHKYGPHAFHTNNKQVWDYLSRFTEWHPYFHKVRAFVNGKTVPIPFNFDTLSELFPHTYAQYLEEKLIKTFGTDKKVSVLSLRTTDDKDISTLGKFIYEKFYAGYSSKQWGVDPSKLDTSVIGRVPVNLSRDDRYFQDKYQAVPLNGYAHMAKQILNHKNIQVKLNTDYNEIKNLSDFKKIIFTGSIDEFFNYKYGKLPYRSLDFKLRKMSRKYFQDTAQVNYSENYDFTRITEFKHFNDYECSGTVIAFEYPMEYTDGQNEPYYPITNKENNDLYEKYRTELSENVIMLGRLGEYKYLNMDQAVENALSVFNQELTKDS